MSSLNYKLAGFLILLGALSGIVFLLAFYLRNFKPESTLGRRIPHWAKELAMSLTGQTMAISVILLSGMNLAPQYLVSLSWFVGTICFLKLWFLLPDLGLFSKRQFNRASMSKGKKKPKYCAYCGKGGGCPENS